MNTRTPAGPLPAAFAECVPQSIGAVMASLCGGVTTPLVTGLHEVPCDSVFGIIAIVGSVTWSLVIGVPPQTATPFARAFLGAEIDFDSPDMGDAVGELANIVAGDLVVRLEAIGVDAAVSLPTVARGHDVRLFLPADLPSLTLAFASPVGELWVKMAGGEATRRSLRQ